MRASGSRPVASARDASEMRDAIRQAFAEFLKIPTCIIVGFLLLATGVSALDHVEIAWLEPARGLMRARVFANSRATADLLSVIAGGIITVTSITISLLLVAVQQTASSMTDQVFDQFLRRRHNQAYFGFFVGLSLYTLLTLATVNAPYNPVFGASLALLLTVIALYLLILLLYTAIDQMRPAVIIEAIHNHTLAARERQRRLIYKTRREPRYAGAVSEPVKTARHGFVMRIDVDAIGAAASAGRNEVEVVLLTPIGSYVVFEDVIAEVKARTVEEAVTVGDAVQRAVHLAHQQDISADAVNGIEELEMIAWTSISTAKSNPSPGLLAIRGLRDILARWSAEEDVKPGEEPFPIVYPDNALARLMSALESLAVVSSESMQHQAFTEVIHTVTVMFDRLPGLQQRRAEDLILRIISALGDHVLTAGLNDALSALIATLRRSARFETALAVQAAQGQLALSVGKLNSRSTRSAERKSIANGHDHGTA